MALVELKVLAVGDPAVAGYTKEAEELWQKFPHKVHFNVVPWAKYYDAMMETLNGDGSYDIVMVAGHLWKREFVEKEYIRKITVEQEDILPVIREECTYQGASYLSPSFCDGHMIVYRKPILQEVLGKLPGEVITPQEYIEIAGKLHEHGHQIVMKADESEIFTDALPFLRMYGTDVYDSQTHAVQCDNSKVTAGLSQYVGLKAYACEGTDTYGNEQVAEALRSGKAAMGITWSGQMGEVCSEACIRKEEIGFATLTTAWNVTWSFAVTAKSKHIREAEELLTYLRSEEVDKRAGNYSGAPVRESTYQAGMRTSAWYRTQLEMFAHAAPLPDIEHAGEKNSVLYEEIFAAFTGKKSAEHAMQDAARAIRKR